MREPERRNHLPALPRHRRKRQGGFTLIEALLVITLVVVGMTAVFYLMTVGTRMSIDSRETMLSYQAANAMVDYVRQQPLTSISAVTDVSFGSGSGTLGQIGRTALTQLTNGQGTYTVASYGGNTDLWQVTVKVKWSRRSSTRDQITTITTLLTDKGLNERWK